MNSYTSISPHPHEIASIARPYSDMEALAVSARVGPMKALLDPRYKAWWAKKHGNGPAAHFRGFDEGNVHPDDPCRAKGFR